MQSASNNSNVKVKELGMWKDHLNLDNSSLHKDHGKETGQTTTDDRLSRSPPKALKSAESGPYHGGLTPFVRFCRS